MSLTPNYGTCKAEGCLTPSERVLVVSGRCTPCRAKRFRAYGQPKPGTERPMKPRKPLKKARKPTGEAEMFKTIWQTRKHICVSCGGDLGNEAYRHYFSHIIRKSKREDLRLVPENIVLECFDCHWIWDHGTIDKKITLNSFGRKMAYIMDNDPGLYLRLSELVKQSKQNK